MPGIEETLLEIDVLSNKAFLDEESKPTVVSMVKKMRVRTNNTTA